jgi:hypothetical protein
MHPISEYGELTEIKRKHLFDLPGHQIGNPFMAAAIILKTSLLEDPPLRLLLGSDAVAYALLKVETLKNGIEANAEISLSTDYSLQEA